MKELTVEEKARAYDKVRKKIALRFGSNVAEEIFSEFEMDEDDIIRKELIDFINSRLAGFPQREKFIAWLEK